jgi:hypothetical protein
MSGSKHRSTMQVSMHVGEAWQVICHAYKWETPILVVSTGPASMSISITDGHEDMPGPAVAFARELAASAQRFADECERLHALHQKASGDDGTPAPAGVTAGQKS